MTTDTDIDELEASRALDTDPRGLVPPPDFVGTPPDRIDGAPEWANTLILEVREARAETQAVRGDLRKLLKNQELQKRQFGLFRSESRDRFASHDEELEQIREDIADAQMRLSRLELERRHG